MKKNLTKKLIAGLSLFALMVILVPVSRASAMERGMNEPKGKDQTTRISDAKSRADQEIERRIKSMSELTSRMGEMKKLSDTDRAALSAMIKVDIDNLTALKAKIDADTDTATLKTDVQSITKSYRTYMLLMPKIRILAAADRMDTTTDMLGTIVTKLQAAIASAQTVGKDVTAMNASLADMQAKIADAKTQYANAKAAVTTLVPDNGTQSVIDANKAALEKARDMIKAGAADLKAASADAKSIRDALKAMGIKLELKTKSE